MFLRLFTTILLAGLLAPPLRAQDSPTVGLVSGPGCTSLVDIQGGGGELYAMKADGFSHSDWQMETSPKGGPTVGMLPGDVEGGSYQVLDNWNRVTSATDTAFVLVTFPDGGLYVDSGKTDGYNYVGSGLVSRVGDSPAALSGNAGITLPGTSAGWFADLGAGPVAFPQSTLGGVRVAFAPIPELNAADLGGCGLGGAAADPASGAGLIVGYNVFRVVDAGLTPTPAELGDTVNWVAYLPLSYGADTSNTLVTLVDPDAAPYTGDEVMVFHDAPVHGDGSPRSDGTPPDPSGLVGNWYAFQPVVAGDVSDWLAISLTNLPPADHAADLDGDGLVDAVDLDPGAGNGPEFISPQAESGHGGLGLTNAGLPLLSAPVYGLPLACPSLDPLVFEINDVTVSLSGPSDVEVRWSDRSVDIGPGTSYQVASDLVSTMHQRGTADAACTAVNLTSTSHADARPVTDDCWYYLVRAVDPCSVTPDDTWGRNSRAIPRPACR